MKKFKLNDKVKAALTSKHAGYIGTVVNADGAFLTMREDTNKPNPLSYKSALHEGYKVYQLDRRLAIKLKDTNASKTN